MLFSPDYDSLVDALENHLWRSKTITVELANAVTHSCPHVPQHPTPKAKLLRLIESGAFTDAVLALIELEAPDWKLRRLLYDNSEWHCSLSKQLGLPADLDEMAEASHSVLPLAILGALAEARSMNLRAREVRSNSVPQVRPVRGYPACCDNFR
jgi:hypothetical protein